MKKIASALTALALAAPVATTASADELSVSTTVAFESAYIFRGVQFAETSFQPGIDLAYGNFYGGVWLNLPVGDDDLVVTPGGEELDFFAGYSSSLSETVSYDVGVTFYTFPDASSGLFDMFSESAGTGSSTVELFAGLSFDAPLAPALYVYRDFNFNTVTIEGSGGYSFPLSESTSFDVAGAVGYVVDDDDGGDYLYGSISADVAYAISDDSAITAGVRYGGSDIDGGQFIDDSIAGTTKSSGFWWGVGFSSSF